MQVIHALWLPRRSDRKESRIFIWGEDPTALRDMSPRVRTRLATANHPHPFSVSPTVLLEALPTERSLQPRADGVALPLPSLPRLPLPSPGVPRSEVAPSLLKGQPALETWGIAGISLALPEGIAWLADGASLGAGDWRIAATSQSWVVASRLALEILAGQRFLPVVLSGAPGLEARWKAILSPGDWDRLRRLAETLPGIARSALPAESAEALLQQFLDEAVDSWIRCHTPRGTEREPGWVGALSNGAAFTLPPVLQSRWPEQSLHWSSLLLSPAGRAGLRTVLRLEAPSHPQEPWRLASGLSAVDDPSLMLEAATVWAGLPASLRQRYGDPQERLLGDLARASRLFPPLSKALKQRRPEAAMLPLEEAFQFLNEGAGLLQAAGFTVMLPRGLESRGASLSVRVKIRSRMRSKAASSSGLGDVLAFDWEAALGDQTLTRAEMDHLAALKMPLVQVRGQWVHLNPDDVRKMVASWGALQKQGLTLQQVVGLASGQPIAPGLESEVRVEADGWVGDMLAGMRSDAKVALLPVPQNLQGVLRPYQQLGYSWLSFVLRLGLGACLADDMGLGKTVQVLAYLLSDREMSPSGCRPWLLFCPTSLVGNWRREASRFAPSLSVLVHHGAERETGEAFVESASQSDLVISTYALSYRDQEHLQKVPWAGIIVDEAQNIKNAETRQARAIHAIHAPQRIAMTGTPVENRLSELWSIMQFANPGYLGTSSSFHNSTAVPIERFGDVGARNRLRRIVAPFILRRHKSDPAVRGDLPDKMEAKVYCTLTREQATLYEAVVRESMQSIEGAKGMARRGNILSAMTRLKQVCNHPALFAKDKSTLEGRSGKLQRLREMLEEIAASGEQALVFTQYAEMGEMLVSYLRQVLGRDVLFLHGGTPVKDRERMILRFQDPQEAPPVFVLSLKAGGVGLNLTAATHVFHFDRWWNPAVENQATDRAYRIGQTRNVQVHKYICAGTLEERIDDMIESKKELAENVVGTGESFVTEMSVGELHELFRLRREDVEA